MRKIIMFSVGMFLILNAAGNNLREILPLPKDWQAQPSNDIKTPIDDILWVKFQFPASNNLQKNGKSLQKSKNQTIPPIKTI